MKNFMIALRELGRRCTVLVRVAVDGAIEIIISIRRQR